MRNPFFITIFVSVALFALLSIAVFFILGYETEHEWRRAGLYLPDTQPHLPKRMSLDAFQRGGTAVLWTALVA